MTDPRTGLIVPLMQARVPVELQLEFPLPPEEEPVRDPFTDELYVTYVFEHGADRETAGAAGRDAPPGMPGPGHEHIALRHCAELGLGPAELRGLAAANLRIRRPDLAFTWDPEVRAVAIAFGGDLEAGLVLDDALLDKLDQDVEGDLVVAIPARDVFLASGTGHPDGLDRLRRAVAHVWAGRSRSLLTRDLLVRGATGWTALAPA